MSPTDIHFPIRNTIRVINESDYSTMRIQVPAGNVHSRHCSFFGFAGFPSFAIRNGVRGFAVLAVCSLMLAVQLSVPVVAQDAAPKDAATETTAAAAKPEKPSAFVGQMNELQLKIDGVFGKFNNVLGSVIFFPLFQSSFDHSGDFADLSSKPQERIDQIVDRVTEFKAQLAAKGFTVSVLKYEISISGAGLDSISTADRDEITSRIAAALDRPAKLINGVKVSLTGLESGATPRVSFAAKTPGMPAAVLWLISGAVILTLRMGFINIRGFKHAIAITAGKYDNKADAGEVNHFQALSAALSATVGLGNIAGVTTAMVVGGPGAALWMIIAGLLGMTSKFTECTLGQMYREVRPDGRVMGGAMFYLSKGLAEIGLKPLGIVLAYMFAVLCIGGSFAGGNAYQVNQSLKAISETIPQFKDYPWAYGLIMTFLTGIVILGGIKRIAQVADKIVPIMCGGYVLLCLTVVVMNISHLGAALQAIVVGAFAPEAAYGGILGVMVMGFQRAAFSNEAGVGSAAIAHSAAKTEYPVREGIVALLEPFIDTVVVCTMTASAIIITGAYSGESEEFKRLISSGSFAGLTGAALKSSVPYADYGLAVMVFLFAYSTQISWSYYGERCWAFLFGDGTSTLYRSIFLAFTFFGSVVSAQNALDFGDLMILGMALPNMLGILLLSGKVRKALDEYWAKYKSGALDPKKVA